MAACMSVCLVMGLLSVSAAEGQDLLPPPSELPTQPLPTNPLPRPIPPQLLSIQVPSVQPTPDSQVRVVAVGQGVPVSGISVVSSHGGLFGISACRAPAWNGRPPGVPFTPTSRVNFSLPASLGKGATGHLSVKLDASSGCSGPVSSLSQPFAFPAQAKSAVAAGNPISSRRRGRCRGARTAVRRSAASLRRARHSLLCLLNAARRRRGLHRLRSSRRLRRGALAHSRAMISRSFFSHVGRRGLGLVQRVRRVGYLRGAHRWFVGENLGFGRGRPASPAGMVRAWMGSTGHRANILEPRFRQIGLGVAAGTPGSPRRGATYTTDFGLRR
jgi:uncharacterized protein YkwD